MSADITRPAPAAAAHRWSKRELVRLNAYSFGLAGFILAMDTAVLPILVLEVAPEAAKNTLLGIVGLAGLLAAALVQVPVGWASDRTRSRMGRRLPYMLWACLCLPIGLAGLAMPLNYASLLVIWLFIQINSGIGYSPYLASIRDLVPANRMGVAASIKTLVEALGGASVLCLAALMVSRYSGPEAAGWLWATLAMFAGVILVTAAISALTMFMRMREAGGAAAAAFHRSALTFPESTSMARLHPDLAWFVVSRGAFMAAVVIFTTYGLFFLRDKVQVENPAQALGVAIIGIGGGARADHVSVGLAVGPDWPQAGAGGRTGRRGGRHRGHDVGEHLPAGGGGSQRSRRLGGRHSDRALGAGQRPGHAGAGGAAHGHREPGHAVRSGRGQSHRPAARPGNGVVRPRLRLHGIARGQRAAVHHRRDAAVEGASEPSGGDCGKGRGGFVIPARAGITALGLRIAAAVGPLSRTASGRCPTLPL